MGVLGITVPESAGGLGMTVEDLVPLLIECGRAGLPDPVSGSALVAAAVVPEARLDAVAGGLAVAVGDNPLVAQSLGADAVLMIDGDAVTLADDFTAEPVDAVDAARGLGRVTIGGGERLDVDAGRVRSLAALGAAAELVGLAQTMADMTVEYVSERKQFGVPIGSFQAVKHHLADATLQLQFAGPLVLRAGYSIAHDDADADVHVSMAKAKASDAAMAVAGAALQCHGAIGYTVECDLHLYMKRVWGLAEAFGSAAEHRRLVRGALLSG